MDTPPAELKESFNEMISMIPEDLVIDEEFKKKFLTQHKRFEEIISDIVISEIRQDYDTSKIFLNNWIVKIRDGNLETINYDARLHYMDNEYITGSSLYNSLYNSLYKLHKNEPVDADFIEIGTMAHPTTNDGTHVNVEGSLPCQRAYPIRDNHSGGAENIPTPSSQNSFGEEFMPESYYEKQKSELIIEYLVFLSEKSFYLFRQTCIIFIRVIRKVLIEILKLSGLVVGTLLKAAFFALFQFIFQNYLDPIYELLKNLNPFKIPFEKPFENNKEYEEKIEEEINKLKTEIEEIKTKYGSEIKDIQNAQNEIQIKEYQNNYFWIAEQLLKAATGPILLAIKHHATQSLFVGGETPAMLGT